MHNINTVQYSTTQYLLCVRFAVCTRNKSNAVEVQNDYRLNHNLRL